MAGLGTGGHWGCGGLQGACVCGRGRIASHVCLGVRTPVVSAGCYPARRGERKLLGDQQEELNLETVL